MKIGDDACGVLGGVSNKLEPLTWCPCGMVASPIRFWTSQTLRDAKQTRSRQSPATRQSLDNMLHTWSWRGSCSDINNLVQTPCLPSLVLRPTVLLVAPLMPHNAHPRSEPYIDTQDVRMPGMCPPPCQPRPWQAIRLSNPSSCRLQAGPLFQCEVRPSNGNKTWVCLGAARCKCWVGDRLLPARSSFNRIWGWKGGLMAQSWMRFSPRDTPETKHKLSQMSAQASSSPYFPCSSHISAHRNAQV